VPLNDPMVGVATGIDARSHALGYFYPRDDLMESRALARGLPRSSPATDGNRPRDAAGRLQRRARRRHHSARRLFRIAGCESLSFHVTSGPAAPFSLFAPGPFGFPGGPLHTDELRIWVMFTGRSPGTSDVGAMTVVARNAFNDEVQRWENIPIVADSVARPKVAVALVLDESGSMLAGAGNNRTRLEVLKLAVTTFVDQLYDDNGLAMAAFANTGRTQRPRRRRAAEFGRARRCPPKSWRTARPTSTSTHPSAPGCKLRQTSTRPRRSPQISTARPRSSLRMA
jgi:hypothetical protein